MNQRRNARVSPVRKAAVLAALVLLVVAGVPQGAAADDPVPNSCKLHPAKVLNPGCVPATTDVVRGEIDAAVEGATGYEIAYPDLVPDITRVHVLRNFTWDPETQTIVAGKPELAFDTLAKNLGDVPVDVLADDLTAQNQDTTVSQCVGWTTDFVCRERVPAGGFSWHEEHTHFHFNDFGHYQFRRTLADGTPDYSAAGLIAVSEKVSFCLVDSAKIRDDAFPVYRYNHCSNQNQGISPGWADIYGSTLEGQQFALDGVPDGRYALIVDMDTSNTMLETNDNNNRVEIVVDVSVDPDTATIVSRRHP